nr:DUF177 domain-containing protein [Rhabdobacter roseus]
MEDKQYVYEFESGDAFFEEMQQDIVQNGHFRTHLTLDKSATMIQMNFHIQGSIGLICDRSLEAFDEPIELTQRMILKFGDHDEELTEEIEIIRRSTAQINVARYIFDFIVLSLPMKKLHPSQRSLTDPVEATDEEGTLVYSSGTPAGNQEAEASPEDAPVDPRWEALKKLKGE